MESSSSDGSESPNDLWQDELCLQPLQSYPGFSQLCNLCILVCRQKQQRTSKAHVEFLSTLEESAKRGCRLCNLLLEWFREEIQAKSITRVSLKYRLNGYFGLEFESPSKKYRYSLQAEEVGASHYISPLKQGIEGNTSSESNKIMARWWFQRCRDHHQQCTPAGSSGRKFPNGLLEVGISFNGPTVKVVETQLLQDIEYMTLSHCWGGSLPLCLLNAKLQAYKTRISFSSLPKTFQDALSVVGWFGIKYLWIDALCIIQDSENDWVHESGRMRDYYKYSFGTIAATGASNPSEGLFFDRNPTLVPPFRAIIGWQGKERAVAITYGGSCLKILREEPLNQRGWVLQERYLSRRVLHFGRGHMSWECQTEISCETWPNTLPHLVYSMSRFALTSKYSPPSHNYYGSSSIQLMWSNLVSTYSRMALTRLSDKCVAFAGIAEEYQATTGDDYVAGLWRRNLVEQLLWRRTSFRRGQYPENSSARPQYIAPSWSWLSINRAVELPRLKNLVFRTMVAVNAEVENSTENKFGAIKNGVIGAWGALVPAICSMDGACRWHFHSIRSKLVDYTQVRYNIYLDESHYREHDESLYCLPILDIKEDDLNPGAIHGLLVVPTLRVTAQYRRIGTFSIGEPEAYDLLEIPRALSDDLNGTGFENFTIV